MEVLKSVEDMFTIFQLFMLKLPAKNSQNQDTTPTSSQQNPMTQNTQSS